MRNLKLVFTLLGFVLATFLIYVVFFRTASTPWQESGHFVLAVRTVPGVSKDTMLHIGLDNFKLYKKDGSTENVSVLTRRIALNPDDTSLEIVLDTLVPIGDYSGFAFVLKSPELRNSWEGDDAPDVVTLLQENIRLDVPYTIEKDVTSSVILSFETNNVIHTNEGEDVLLPVIQLETRGNTQLTGGGDEPIAIVGGDILHSVTFGMDWDGRMRLNFRARQKKVLVEETETESTPVATTTTETPESVSTTTNVTRATSTQLDVSTTTQNQ